MAAGAVGYCARWRRTAAATIAAPTPKSNTAVGSGIGLDGTTEVVVFTTFFVTASATPGASAVRAKADIRRANVRMLGTPVIA